MERQQKSIREELTEEVIESREQLVSYIASRVSDREQAKDILQTSLLKALKAAPDLESRGALMPWFHRIVQNSIVDTYRERDRTRRKRNQYATEREPHVEPETPSTPCRCYRDVLPALKESDRKLIEEMELGHRDTEEMAEELGVTRNALNVRRYRARQRLRKRLVEECTTCHEQGFDSCEC